MADAEAVPSNSSSNSSDENRHPWEISKENIQPLSHGRKVTLLTNSLQAISISDENTIQKDIDELASKLDQPDSDPLGNWVKYFAYFEQFRLNEHPAWTKVYINGLMKCVRQFLQNPRPEIMNDKRYVEIFLKNLHSAEGDKRIRMVEASMSTQGLGKTVAYLYIRLSEDYEALNDFKSAVNAVQRGISAKAEPIESLEEHLKNLQYRVAENVAKSLRNENANPRSFGASVPVQPEGEAPTFRHGLAAPAKRLIQSLPETFHGHQPKISVLEDDQENARAGGPSVPVPTGTIVRELDQVRSDTENQIQPGKWTKPENKFIVPVEEDLEKIEIYQSFSEEPVPVEKLAITKPVLQDRKVEEPIVEEPRYISKEPNKPNNSQSFLSQQSIIDSNLSQNSVNTSSHTRSSKLFNPPHNPSYGQAASVPPALSSSIFDTCTKSLSQSVKGPGVQENTEVKLFGGNKGQPTFADFQKPLHPEPKVAEIKMMCNMDRVMIDGREISFEEIMARKYLKQLGPPQENPILLARNSNQPKALSLSEEELSRRIQASAAISQLHKEIETLTLGQQNLIVSNKELKEKNNELMHELEKLVQDRSEETVKLNMAFNRTLADTEKWLLTLQERFGNELSLRDSKIELLEEKVRSMENHLQNQRSEEKLRLLENYVQNLAAEVQALNGKVAISAGNIKQELNSNSRRQIKIEIDDTPEDICDSPSEPIYPLAIENGTVYKKSAPIYPLAIENGTDYNKSAPIYPLAIENGTACKNSTPMIIRNESMNTAHKIEIELTKPITTVGPEMELDSQFEDSVCSPLSKGFDRIPPPEPTQAIFKQPCGEEADFNISNLTRALTFKPQPLECSTPEKKDGEPKEQAYNFSVPNQRRRSLFNQTIAEVGQNLSTIPENSENRSSVSSSGSSGGGQTTLRTSTFRTTTPTGNFTSMARSRFMPGQNPFSYD